MAQPEMLFTYRPSGQFDTVSASAPCPFPEGTRVVHLTGWQANIAAAAIGTLLGLGLATVIGFAVKKLKARR